MCHCFMTTRDQRDAFHNGNYYIALVSGEQKTRHRLLKNLGELNIALLKMPSRAIGELKIALLKWPRRAIDIFAEPSPCNTTVT